MSIGPTTTFSSLTMAIRKPRRRKMEIDIDGPAGNCWFLLGTAEGFAEQIGWSKEYIQEMLTDMQSADYEHLIEVFDKHFGSFVDLIRR